MSLKRMFVVGVAVCAGALGTAGNAHAAGPDWGAIAINHAERSFLMVTGFPTRESVEAAALEYCAQDYGSPCQLFGGAFYKTCAAVGMGGDGGLKVEYDQNRQLAELKVQFALGITGAPGTGSALPELVGSGCSWETE